MPKDQSDKFKITAKQLEKAAAKGLSYALADIFFSGNSFDGISLSGRAFATGTIDIPGRGLIEFPAHQDFRVYEDGEFLAGFPTETFSAVSALPFRISGIDLMDMGPVLRRVKLFSFLNTEKEIRSEITLEAAKIFSKTDWLRWCEGSYRQAAVIAQNYCNVQRDKYTHVDISICYITRRLEICFHNQPWPHRDFPNYLSPRDVADWERAVRVPAKNAEEVMAWLTAVFSRNLVDLRSTTPNLAPSQDPLILQ